MGLSNKLSCRAGSFSCCCLNPTGVFSLRFEASFPCAGALGCVVYFSPQLFLPESAHECGTTHSTSRDLLRVLSARLPVSAPPTGLDECVFFNSLVVGLPYSLIFRQFWLVFVSKLLLSFFWLCEKTQCVYLRLHLGQKSFFFNFECRKLTVLVLAIYETLSLIDMHIFISQLLHISQILFMLITT